MDKIKSYRRIYRICPKMYREMLRHVPKNLIYSIADPPKRKKCLSEDEVKDLLHGHVTIDEKIDGGVLGLTWSGEIPLVVGKHSMVNYDLHSKKFHGLNSWIYENYENIQKIPLGWIIFGEWMRSCHQIFYDELPAYFLVFDIWDGYRYLDLHNRSYMVHKLGFAEVPFIYSGDDLNIEDVLCIADGLSVSNKSRLSSNETFEGVVIKNYDKQLYGKYVRREFMESIEKHWFKRPLIENKLRNYKSCQHQR